MKPVISVFLGIVAAGSVHAFAWWVRLHHRTWSLVLGAFGAMGLTTLALVYILASDIGHFVQTPLLLAWGFASVIGILQAASIPAPWWQGILGLLFEMTLGFIVLSGLNLSLQNLVLRWRLADRFPETFAIPSEIVDRLIFVFLFLSAALALIRPVGRLLQRSLR